jgi:hypothetical protein
MNQRSSAYVLVHACFGKVLEQLKLAESAEAEERVLEREDALDRDLLTRRLVQRAHDGAIRALAERAGDLVVGACVTALG